MSNFVDKTSVVEAASIYKESKLMGRDFKVTLPEVTPVTADVGGLMGTMPIPLLNTIEEMELTISKVGVDDYAVELCNPGSKNLIIKWAQDVVKSDGSVKAVGCKAELSVLPKTYMPAADIEVGSASEFDCTYGVFIYKLYVDGKCRLEINRMTGTLKAWNGKSLQDFSGKFSQLL